MTQSSHEERRPGQEAANSKSLAGDKANTSVTHRRYWAQQLLDAGPNWPRYGSPQWAALQIDDPRRVAACVAAAEIYTRDFFDNLEERLRVEIEQARVAFKREEDAEYVRSYTEHREAWSRKTSSIVSTSFKARRRQQLREANTSRPSDFPGRRGDAS